MKAEIKSVHSPDVALAAYSPDPGERFSILLELSIGPVGREGADLFSVVVSSRGTDGEGTVNAGGRMEADSFDLSDIMARLAAHVADAQGATWEELAAALGPLLTWEFDNYKPWEASG